MMFYLLNKDFETIYIIDSYISAIWTDRYCGYGDFELVISPCTDLGDYILKSGHDELFLAQPDSDRLMFVETKRLITDIEQGDKLIISGRSLESVLCRRIVWGLTYVKGTIQNVIEKLLNDSIISPVPKGNIGNARKISNFIFSKTTDKTISELSSIHGQYTGKIIYDIVLEICETYNIGFKVILNSKKQLVFSLYNGEDRSQYIIFSEDFGNLINTNFYESYENFSNVTLIGGEDKENSRVYQTFTKETNSGLNRHESFTDARDIRSTDSNGVELNSTEYNKLLVERGKIKLNEKNSVKSFEGEFETSVQYQYGVDYAVGDIVKVKNDYGISSNCRISEIVFSKDENGEYAIPTFVSV